ncbi:hypothetical protein D3C78_1956940 [compost metagenome]
MLVLCSLVLFKTGWSRISIAIFWAVSNATCRVTTVLSLRIIVSRTVVETGVSVVLFTVAFF